MVVGPLQFYHFSRMLVQIRSDQIPANVPRKKREAELIRSWGMRAAREKPNLRIRQKTSSPQMYKAKNEQITMDINLFDCRGINF